MSTENLGLIELVLVFGGVFAFGAYELWSLRRAQRKGRQDEPEKRR